MRQRRYFPGDKIGLLAVVRRLEREPGAQPRFVVACSGCGERRVVPGHVLSRLAALTARGGAPLGGLCRTCFGRALSKPRRCRTCDATGLARFGRGKADECMSCARAAYRNGRCDCGRAIRFQRARVKGDLLGVAHPVLVCACGRLPREAGAA